MITSYNKISYFGFKFDWKSTLSFHIVKFIFKENSWNFMVARFLANFVPENRRLSQEICKNSWILKKVTFSGQSIRELIQSWYLTGNGLKSCFLTLTLAISWSFYTQPKFSCEVSLKGVVWHGMLVWQDQNLRLYTL